MSGLTTPVLAALITIGVLWLWLRPDNPNWGEFLSGALVIAGILAMYEITVSGTHRMAPNGIVAASREFVANPVHRRTIRMGVHPGVLLLAIGLPLVSLINAVRFWILLFGSGWRLVGDVAVYLHELLA
jgi:hypothetical protein